MDKTNPSQAQIHHTISQNLSSCAGKMLQHESEAKSEPSINGNRQQHIEQRQPVEGYHNILLEVLHGLKKDQTHSQQNWNDDQHDPITNVNNNGQDAIPEPLSSDQQQSNQVQYLSYIENQPLPDPQPQPSPQPILNQPQSPLRNGLPYPLRQQFLSILYQSVIYVRKSELRTKIDDELLADRLGEHLEVSTSPVGRDQIGRALLANGYFLVGFAVLMGRVNRSEVLFGYIMRKFYEKLEAIQDNYQQFLFYHSKPPQYFNLSNPQQLLSSSYRHTTPFHPTNYQKSPSLGLKRNIIQHYNSQQEPQIQNQFQNQNSREEMNRMKSTKATMGTVENGERESCQRAGQK